jgi:hypothetical protein
VSAPLYTVQASSEAWPNAGSQAERALNIGFLPDAFLNSTGGETANISPSTATEFTSTGDQTAIYTVGRRLRIIHGSASTDTTYAEVASATFGAGITTVHIRNITSGATALSTAAISVVGVSPIWASSGTGNFPRIAYHSFAIGSSAASSGLLRLENSTMAIVGKTTNGTDDVIWPLQYGSTSLGSDQSLGSTGAYSPILTKSVSAGAHLVAAHATFNTTGAAAMVQTRLTDGTNVYGTAYNASVGGSTVTGVTLSMQAVVAQTSPVTYVLDFIAGSTLMRAKAETAGTIASTAATALIVVKLG